jgi:hypothetical protein
MAIIENQQAVAVDLTGLPECINYVSRILESSLQREEEKRKFRYGHIMAVMYNQWLLCDKQASNRYGQGSNIGDRNMLMLHDVTASFVDALSATVLPSGVKLSTSTSQVEEMIIDVIEATAEAYHMEVFRVEPVPRAQITLREFPYCNVLNEWEVVRARAARFSGSFSQWRVPDPKSEMSLLASGIHLNGDIRTCVGVSALPQRLEKICIAMGLIEYDRLGTSSFVPQIIDDDDNSSFASRCACYTGLALTTRNALDALMVGMAPLSKV